MNVIASDQRERGNPCIASIRTGVWIAASCFALLAMTAKAQESPVQQQLVQAAANIRGIERQLQNMEGQLDELNIRKNNLEQEYNTRRARMAGTLSALTRMGSTPKEAALVRPGGPLQAARTTMLLSASLPAIETQASSFRNLLTDLEKTRTQLNDQTAQAQATRTDLASRHAKLSAMMNARGGVAPSQAEEAAIAKLVRESRSLRDLLSGMEQTTPETQLLPPTGPDEGQLPVSGIIRTAYGQKDNMGEKSDGLSIETLPGSVVVAPLSGIVRFTGPFRGYGNIVILAHAGGYFSLIAGLDKINVSTGQTIVSGEPIAILNAPGTPNQTAPRRTVYYELRYGGQPVNPSRKLPDLG